MFSDLVDTKLAILDHKNIDFKKSIFSKGLVHGFRSKIEN